MTEGQYRALIAYLNFWTPHYNMYGLDQAIEDIGITDDRKTVLYELYIAGWDYDEEMKRLIPDEAIR